MSELFNERQILEILLRDYQIASIELLRVNIRSGVRNQVLCIATGGGKTVCACFLLHECYKKGMRAVMVVDRITLINQTSDTLDRYGVPHGVIQADHWRRNDELIQVASAQTLAKRGWPKDLALIIVDECHTQQKKTLEEIGKRAAITVGLSATPFSDGLGKYYDSVVNVTTTNKLTNEGHLVPFKVFAASEPDMSGAKIVGGEWSDKDCEERALPIIGDCVKEYAQHGEEKKFIAFGVTITHCKALREQFVAAGVRTELFTCNTQDYERAEILREFRKPDSAIRGLISVAALSKGFDVPDVGCIIMCRPLRKSLSEHIQILGRGLRPAKGKTVCTVLDHSGNMVRFWDDMHEFFEDGIAVLDDGTKKKKKKPEKKEQEFRKCPSCFCVHKPRPSCPECGHVYETRQVTHVSGDLYELGTVTGTKADKQSFYSQLLAIAQERNRSAGWVAHSYRAKWGVWPRNLDDEPIEPSFEVRNWVRHRNIAYAKAQEKARSAMS